MIYLLCCRGETETIGKLIRGMPGLRATIRTLTYDRLFRRPSAPVAHYIFTDHDRLTAEELERAAGFARAAGAADAGVQILNHPLRALERYGLSRRLAGMGFGGFDMVRLDEGRSPRFPAFIRCESGMGRPDTGLLRDDAELAAALAGLEAAGKTRKGRVAVQYVDTRSADGRYRKYGAVRVGARIVPQHLLVADDWYVKMEDAQFDAAIAAEELAFVTGNPHREDLMRVFEAAGLQYGRADYAVVDGRVIVFEINTNPSLPRPGDGDLRDARRALVCRELMDAFRALDTPLAGGGAFRIPRDLRPPGLAARLHQWCRAAAIRSPTAAPYFRWRRRQRFQR